MKKLTTPILALFIFPFFLSGSPIKDCQCKSIPLFGKVKFVEYNADFKVKIVKYNADLHVKYVESNPNTCGLWRIVEWNPGKPN